MISIPAPKSSSVADAYIHQEPEIQALFPYAPYTDSSYEVRLEQLDQREKAYLRKELVQVLRTYHQQESRHPEIAKNLDLLEQSGTSAVIGGQQAGLLSGPLFTLYKAITVIQLAKREQKRLGRPVVPVFWIAGEDHDREEIDHVWLQNAQGTMIKHTYPREMSLSKRPISHITLHQEEMKNWINQLAWQLPDTPYKSEWLTVIEAAAAKANNWTCFFAEIMFELFGKYGVILIDSQDEQVRKLEKPFFQKLLEKEEQISQRVAATLTDIEQMGYVAPLTMDPDQAHFFVLENGERQALLREKEGYRTRDTGNFYSHQDLIAQPELLSTNVITRTLMQEMLFPTLAFVAGPGEIAYWAAYGTAFEEMDCQMPIVYPRLNITLMEPNSAKRWEEFQLEWDNLFGSLSDQKEEWFRLQKPPEAVAMIEELKGKLATWYQPVIQYLSEEISTHLETIGEKNLQKHWQQIDYFSKQTDRIIREKHQTSLRHWDEIIQSLQPNQKLQERVHNVIPFWNQYGLHWLEQLVEQDLLQGKGDHIVAYL